MANENRLKVDLVGQKFSRLTVTAEVRDRGRKSWRCQCDCGNETLAQTYMLRAGSKMSCGCFHKELARQKIGAEVTHGLSGSKVYWIWAGMIARCTYPTSSGWKNYGGRGIKVCERWHSFENFFADMGHPPPGYSIERVDNNGNYEPANCKWIPRGEQGRNTRRSLKNRYPQEVPNGGR